jgi:hypothetical protein
MGLGEVGMPMDARTNRTRSLEHVSGNRLVWLLEHVGKVRWSSIAMIGALFFLLLGEVFVPGANPYYGYQMFQVMVVLTVVISLELVFFQQGGLAWPTHAIISATVIADVVGTTSDFYHRWGPYDKVVHVSSAAAFAAGSYDILSGLVKRGVLEMTANKRWLFAVAISFLVTGLIWETYEFLADVVFHTDRVQDAIDTRNDLISNISGSGAAATVLWLRERARVRRAQESDRFSSS